MPQVLDTSVTKLEAEATALQNAAEQAHSLQLVIGKLETFAALVRNQLDEADWATRRDLIRTLGRRIEVDDQHVRVVFRVGPEPQDGAGSRRVSHLCPGHGLGTWWRRSAFSLKGTRDIRVGEGAPSYATKRRSTNQLADLCTTAVRRHSALDFVSPAQFERRAASSTALH